jgi:hypothetical protein
MTPRTFWAILIKIIGVYIILESTLALPQFISTIFFYLHQRDGIDHSDSLLAISYLLLISGIYILILWFCIFRTNSVIDKLKLDQGYDDERFEFNIHRSTILKIVIMVTGGFLMIESFPLLCTNILNYAKMVKDYNRIMDVPASKYILFAAIQLFIGYFMLSCNRLIVNFMEVRRKKVIIDDIEE